MSDLRFCKDCVHYMRSENTHYAKCAKTKPKPKYDLISGQVLLGLTDTCYNERNPVLWVFGFIDYFMRCGPRGRFFEPKDTTNG